MKLKIKQNILIEHLNYVIKGISSKNLIPILNCIKLDLTKKGLTLISTDNEIAIQSFIDKKYIEQIEEEGTIVVFGKFLYDIVKKLPNEIIIIEELIDSKINISTINSSFNLNCNKVDEFPQLELEKTNNPILIEKKVFKNIISGTIFAASIQESRPVLTGVNFKTDSSKLECIATDSYRLSKQVIEINKVSEKTNIIIPTKNLNELLKLLNDDDELIEMHIFNNKVIFKFSTIIMLSRIINDNYPDTNALIPKTYETILKVNLNNFFACIDRASLLSDNDKNTIKLETKDDLVIITSNIPEIGNIEEKINVKNINKTNIKIAFSSKYMSDALKALKNEEIFLMFNSDVKPIILKNDEKDESLQLILPIRTY